MDVNSPRPIRRILVPFDFSPPSSAALEQAVSLAKMLGASIHLMHVWSEPMSPADPTGMIVVPFGSAADAANVARQLTDTRLEAIGSGVSVTARIERGIPADVIVTVAAEHDMIVMGTRGRTGLAGVLIGSVAKQVVASAPCPVMVVRATKAAVEAKVAVETKAALGTVHAIFNDADQLEAAYQRLIDAQFKPDDISLLMTDDTKDGDFRAAYRNRAAEGVATGGVFGGAIGGILGGLTVLGSTLTGGVGLLVVGPLIAFAAMGGLFGGLVGAGIPTDQAHRIQSALAEGKVLLAVHPQDGEERRRAERILTMTHGELLALS